MTVSQRISYVYRTSTAAEFVWFVGVCAIFAGIGLLLFVSRERIKVLVTGLANMYRQDQPYATGRKAPAYQASGDAEDASFLQREEDDEYRDESGGGPVPYN